VSALFLFLFLSLFFFLILRVYSLRWRILFGSASKTNKKRIGRKGVTDKKTLSDDESATQSATDGEADGLTGMSIHDRVIMLADAMYLCTGMGQISLAVQFRERALHLVSYIHDEV
jgi:hypothetical protein